MNKRQSGDGIEVTSRMVVRVKEAPPNEQIIFQSAADTAEVLTRGLAVKRMRIVTWSSDVVNALLKSKTVASASFLSVAAATCAAIALAVRTPWLSGKIALMVLLLTLTTTAIVLRQRSIAGEQLQRRVEQAAKELLVADPQLAQLMKGAAVGQPWVLLGALTAQRLMGRYAIADPAYGPETEWCVD